MRFQLVTGQPQVITCSGCQAERTAGSEPHLSASGRQLDTVYQDVDTLLYYCEDCAAKHAEGVDPTKAVTQFFADTSGETIA
jgi:hypothetical protein